MSKDKNDDIETENKDKTAPDNAKDTFHDLLEKVMLLGNKKYGFTFSLHGWVIAALGLLLLILILK